MTTGERIRRERTLRGWTQEYLGKMVGLTKSAISAIESGKNQPRQSTLEKIAAAFGIPVSELTGLPENAILLSQEDLEAAFEVPLWGDVSCGPPVDPGQIVEPETLIPVSRFQASFWGIKDAKGIFALRARGDSMFPTIMDGDILVFRETHEVIPRKVLLVRVNGSEFTLKRVEPGQGIYILKPDNPALAATEVKPDNLQVHAVVVGLIRQEI